VVAVDDRAEQRFPVRLDLLDDLNAGRWATPIRGTATSEPAGEAEDDCGIGRTAGLHQRQPAPASLHVNLPCLLE